MEIADFDGAAAGAFGGLVKWYQDPHRALKIADYISSLATSVAGGSICGYAVKSVVQWKYPDIPHDVVLASAAGAGLASGPILQSVVGLVSVLIGRVRLWIDHKFPPPPSGPNGTAAPTVGRAGSEQPKAG